MLDSDAEEHGFKMQPRRFRVTVLGKTVHIYRASVHQAAKLVAALLGIAGVSAGMAKVMTAYRRVYDSRHLHAERQEP